LPKRLPNEEEKGGGGGGGGKRARERGRETLFPLDCYQFWTTSERKPVVGPR